MTESFNNISSAALDKWNPAPTKKGSIDKQGSGQGWFGTTKWKSKLMFVGPPGFACYFDSDKARFPTFIPFAQNARPTAC